MQVIYTFWISEKSKQESANVTATIELPSGFELLDGKLRWQGELLKGSKAELKAIIKAIKKGAEEIRGSASYSPYPGESWGSSQTLYTFTLSDRGFFSEDLSDLPASAIHISDPAFTIEEVVIYMDLSMPHPPALDETAEVTLVATAMQDAPGARISIQSRGAIKILDGNTVWAGDLLKGDQVE